MGETYDLYARLSIAPDGQVETVKWQIELMRRELERTGDLVGRIFVDNSKSAWQRTANRPGFEALLAAIAAGSSRVMLYHMDRYLRQPRDLERLIDQLDARIGGLKLRAIQGQYDLNNSDHRAIVRILVTIAAKSSDDTSRRGKDRLRRNTEEGKLHGGGSYGVNADGTPNEEQAKIVREVARRRLAAEPWTTIAEDLAKRDVRTIEHRREMADGTVKVTGGVLFTRNSLRTMMSKPRLAGYVITGGLISAVRLEDPVLDQETWDALQLMAEVDRRGTNAANSIGEYELTGRVWCDGCERWMQGNNRSDRKALMPECRHCGLRRGDHAGDRCLVPGPEGDATTFAGRPRRVYRCTPDGTGSRCTRTVTAEFVEAIVHEYVIEALGSDRYRQQISDAVATADDTAGRLRAEIARMQSALSDLAVNYGMGMVPEADYRRGSMRLTSTITARRTELDSVTDPAAVEAAAALASRQQWEGATPAERRMLIEALIARVIVHAGAPSRPGVSGRPFTPDRVTVELVRPTNTEVTPMDIEVAR